MEDGILHWTIANFPILTLNFKKVTFHYGDTEEKGLVNSSETITVFTKYQCTKHCTIKLPDEQLYTVPWELKPKRNTRNSKITSNAEEKKPVDSVEDSPKMERHTLPFKVLGTCFTKERQLCLENNRQVDVDLVHESYCSWYKSPVSKFQVLFPIKGGPNYRLKKRDKKALQFKTFLKMFPLVSRGNSLRFFA